LQGRYADCTLLKRLFEFKWDTSWVRSIFSKILYMNGITVWWRICWNCAFKQIAWFVLCLQSNLKIGLVGLLERR
jgi:hypothetical protein